MATLPTRYKMVEDHEWLYADVTLTTTGREAVTWQPNPEFGAPDRRRSPITLVMDSGYAAQCVKGGHWILMDEDLRVPEGL